MRGLISTPLFVNLISLLWLYIDSSSPPSDRAMRVVLHFCQASVQFGAEDAYKGLYKTALIYLWLLYGCSDQHFGIVEASQLDLTGSKVLSACTRIASACARKG